MRCQQVKWAQVKWARSTRAAAYELIKVWGAVTARLNMTSSLRLASSSQANQALLIRDRGLVQACLPTTRKTPVQNLPAADF